MASFHRSSYKCLHTIFFCILSATLEYTECVPLAVVLASPSEYQRIETQSPLESQDTNSFQRMTPAGRKILGISVFLEIIDFERAAVFSLKGCCRNTVLFIALLCVISAKFSIDSFATKSEMDMPRWYVRSVRKSVRLIRRKKIAFKGLVWDRIRNKPIPDSISLGSTAFCIVDKMPTIAEEC